MGQRYIRNFRDDIIHEQPDRCHRIRLYRQCFLIRDTAPTEIYPLALRDALPIYDGAGLSGHVNIGVIVAPALTLIPRAIARAKEEAPNLCIGVEVSTSNDLVVKLKQEHLDFLIARILEREDEPSLLYEDMTEEVVCVVGRRAHPLVAHPKLTLKELAQAKWILSARGSILRNRFDMMFRRADLDMPANVVETTAMSVTMSLLQQTDFLHVMPVEVARYYVATGELAILPIDIPCRMERFGIITSRDQVLSEGANLLLRHIRAVAAEIY